MGCEVALDGAQIHRAHAQVVHQVASATAALGGQGVDPGGVGLLAGQRGTAQMLNLAEQCSRGVLGRDVGVHGGRSVS